MLFVNRETASGETMYEMEVGGVFDFRDDRIFRLRAFASREDARVAAPWQR